MMKFIHIKLEDPRDFFELARVPRARVFYDEYSVPNATLVWFISNRPNITLQVFSCNVVDQFKHLLEHEEMMAAKFVIFD